MDIILAIWQGVRNTANAVIANREAFATLAVLAIPAIGLRLLKH